MAYATFDDDGNITEIFSAPQGDYIEEDGESIFVSKSGVIAIDDADPRIITFHAALTNQFDAHEALSASDRVVLRCWEDDNPVPDDWKQYRRDLRSYIAGKTENMPLQPQKYP